ncbi:MAG TPA: hypothetical protein RMH80_28945 [Polyangiaceae bacterium LLY-WYZ-15_(1-7)]|nr:hypothetical protein [Polyangiaceae bacterium LLY-WYZ-15_(1-7)]
MEPGTLDLDFLLRFTLIGLAVAIGGGLLLCLLRPPPRARRLLREGWDELASRPVELADGHLVAVRERPGDALPPGEARVVLGPTLVEWGRALPLEDGERVLLVAFPGLAAYDPKARYDVATQVARLGELLDALDVRRAHLAAADGFALFAWRYAAAHPERVASLVLVRPMGLRPDAPSEEEQAWLDGDLDAVLPPAEVAGDWLRGLPKRPSWAGEGLALRAADDLDAAAHACLRHLAGDLAPDAFGPASALAAVKAPALVVWGQHDRGSEPENAARFARALADGRTAMLDGCRGAPLEERPEQVAEATHAFWVGLRGEGGEGGEAAKVADDEART